SAKISNVIARRLGCEDREPALVLVNAKWPLVEPIGDLGRAELITLPQMVRYIRPHLRTQKTARSCQECSRLHKISPPHCVSLLTVPAMSGIHLPLCINNCCLN